MALEVMQPDDLQVAAVREEAVTELSKHIKQAQRLEELREADAVSLPSVTHAKMPLTADACKPEEAAHRMSTPICQTWKLRCSCCQLA